MACAVEVRPVPNDSSRNMRSVQMSADGFPTVGGEVGRGKDTKNMFFGILSPSFFESWRKVTSLDELIINLLC